MRVPLDHARPIELAFRLVCAFVSPHAGSWHAHSTPAPIALGGLGLSARLRRFLTKAKPRSSAQGRNLHDRAPSDALRESQEQFYLAFEQAAIGMAWLRPDGTLQRVNHAWCALFGYSPSEMLASSLQAITHADDLPTERALMEQLVAGELATYEIEQRCLHKSGRVLWVQTNVAVVVDHDHQPTQFAKQVQDITERKRAQEVLARHVCDLAEANRGLQEERAQRERLEAELRLSQRLEAIGQLAAGIAHEINTPIQYVGDSAHFLKQAIPDVLRAVDACRVAIEQLPDTPEHATLRREWATALHEADIDFVREELPAALERIFDGVGRVSGIVLAMKEFAHPSERAIEAADLRRVINNTLMVSRNAYKHVATVACELEALPLVPCHTGELSQALLNLIVNAAQAIGAQPHAQGLGRITIRGYVGDEHITLEISDTGAGIPEAVRHRVFEPFFTTKPPGQGTGQGLAIARAIIVERHRGELTFESEPGRGTTFTIRLPLTPPGETAAEVAA